MGQLVFDLLPLLPIGFLAHLACPVVAPQLVGLLQGVQYTLPKRTRPSALGCHHFFDIAHQMREALLLIHSGQLVGFVVGTSIRYQGAGVVARHQFTHLLIAMLGSDLVDGGLVGVEHHQLGWLSTYRPTGAAVWREARRSGDVRGRAAGARGGGFSGLRGACLARAPRRPRSGAAPGVGNGSLKLLLHPKDHIAQASLRGPCRWWRPRVGRWSARNSKTTSKTVVVAVKKPRSKKSPPRGRGGRRSEDAWISSWRCPGRPAFGRPP